MEEEEEITSESMCSNFFNGGSLVIDIVSKEKTFYS